MPSTTAPGASKESGPTGTTSGASSSCSPAPLTTTACGARRGSCGWSCPQTRRRWSTSPSTSCGAKSEAIESGFDEAIVLSIDGHVSEGSAENLFMVKEGEVVTPPVTDDILEGITRKYVMHIVREELKMPVVERSIDRTELYGCDELILCGTGAQISPVIELDHRPIGDGRVGEIAQELQQIYF